MIEIFTRTFSLFVAAVLLAGSVSSLAEDTVTFTFSPGEKITYVQKLTTTKEKDMGEGGAVVDESVSTTNITVTRTKSGWTVLAKPESATFKRNGQVIENPIMGALSSAVVTYELDSSGKITAVKGYPEFVEALSKSVAPEVLAQLAPMLNAEAMNSREIAEWNGRIGDYIGAEVTVGDSFTSTVPFQLPDGTSIEYDVTTTISAVEPCADQSCIRLNQVYDSEADNLAKLAGVTVGNVAKAVKSETEAVDSDQNSARIRGNVTRLIDPATMLIYEEKIERVVEMDVNVPGAGLIPVTMSESRRYEYIY